jgi:hypothetical protein
MVVSTRFAHPQSFSTNNPSGPLPNTHAKNMGKHGAQSQTGDGTHLVTEQNRSMMDDTSTPCEHNDPPHTRRQFRPHHRCHTIDRHQRWPACCAMAVQRHRPDLHQSPHRHDTRSETTQQRRKPYMSAIQRTRDEGANERIDDAIAVDRMIGNRSYDRTSQLLHLSTSVWALQRGLERVYVCRKHESPGCGGLELS